MMSSENDEIKRIGNENCWIKKWDFNTGGLLIGGMPKCLLIWGDHLFLIAFFGGGGGWLITGVD